MIKKRIVTLECEYGSDQLSAEPSTDGEVAFIAGRDGYRISVYVPAGEAREFAQSILSAADAAEKA